MCPPAHISVRAPQAPHWWRGHCHCISENINHLIGWRDDRGNQTCNVRGSYVQPHPTPHRHPQCRSALASNGWSQPLMLTTVIRWGPRTPRGLVCNWVAFPYEPVLWQLPCPRPPPPAPSAIRVHYSLSTDVPLECERSPRDWTFGTHHLSHESS